jgi:hypothetical protein
VLPASNTTLFALLWWSTTANLVDWAYARGGEKAAGFVEMNTERRGLINSSANPGVPI